MRIDFHPMELVLRSGKRKDCPFENKYRYYMVEQAGQGSGTGFGWGLE